MKGRGVREAEGARLESVCTLGYRGFESLPLRQIDSDRSKNSKGGQGVIALDHQYISIMERCPSWPKEPAC